MSKSFKWIKIIVGRIIDGTTMPMAFIYPQNSSGNCVIIEITGDYTYISINANDCLVCG
jgi:hypothetical protein